MQQFFIYFLLYENIGEKLQSFTVLKNYRQQRPFSDIKLLEMF